VGRRIRVREVRVIDHLGEQRGVMLTLDALKLAEDAGLELVEVNPKANPPVCKIMDYGKFKYESAKREREAKKHQKLLEVKEVKFRPKTHEHDYDFKVRHIRRFLEEGDKVRLLVQFRGREIVHPETGQAILERVIRDVADLAAVSQVPSMEGNRINMVLAPKIKPTRPKPRPADGPLGPGEERGTAPPRPAPSGAAPADRDPDDLDDDDDDDDDDMVDDTTPFAVNE
jgi:translation initiation factor IF-3